MPHPVYCRICGHRDDLAYCSQCGLPFDHTAGSTLELLSNRIEMLIQPIFHFLTTWFLLLLVPKAFFESLTTKGRPVNAALIIRRTKTPITFSAWLRPMTPVGYFAFGSLTFNVASEYFDVLMPSLT